MKVMKVAVVRKMSGKKEVRIREKSAERWSTRWKVLAGSGGYVLREAE